MEEEEIEMLRARIAVCQIELLKELARIKIANVILLFIAYMRSCQFESQFLFFLILRLFFLGFSFMVRRYGIFW